MSDIDFQNGFIAGMATRGLTKSIASEPVDPYMKTASVVDYIAFPTLALQDSVSIALEDYYTPLGPEEDPTCSDDLASPILTLSDEVQVILYT